MAARRAAEVQGLEVAGARRPAEAAGAPEVRGLEEALVAAPEVRGLGEALVAAQAVRLAQGQGAPRAVPWAAVQAGDRRSEKDPWV